MCILSKLLLKPLSQGLGPRPQSGEAGPVGRRPAGGVDQPGAVTRGSSGGLSGLTYIWNILFDLPGRRNCGSTPASFIQLPNKERRRESC